MKRIIALIICCVTVAIILCGCNNAAEKIGKNEPTQNSTQQNEDTDKKTDDIDLASYKVPAEVVSIDMSAEDPSTDAIKFVYDDDGKVFQCYYNIGAQQAYVNYTYKENAVQIYAFMGDLVAADESITLPGTYDAGKGFSVIDGYYFKGFDKE